jgi:hypothetical protein
MIGASKDTIDLCLKLGYLVFQNRPISPEDTVTPVIGYTYNRDAFTSPDLMLLMKTLELHGGTGQFVLVLPAGHAHMNWLKNVKVLYSEHLNYADGVHGDAILIVENHPEMHEAQHIALAKSFRIRKEP